MLRHLSIGLLASAVAIAPLPLKAQDGSAEDLGDVMSISLKDVVNPPLASKAHCRVLAPRTKQASVGSCHCQLATTAFGSLMPWSTPTLLIEQVTAASSTPMLQVASPPQPAWATAG